MLPRRPGWTDNLLNFFFLVTCKSYSLIAVACFLPGRAKDLSEPLYTLLPDILKSTALFGDSQASPVWPSGNSNMQMKTIDVMIPTGQN